MDAFPIGSFPVARLGFGAMQLPGPGVFGPPRDRFQAIEVLRLAVELGVNHLDTAQYYGPSVANELIHEALHPYPEDLVLVSKVGARRDASGGWLPANSPAELRSGVEDNLRSLEIDRLHAVNLRVMPGPVEGDVGDRLAEQLEAMAELQREGLIAGVGISNVSLEQLHFARSLTEVVCVQNPMNVVDRSSAEVLRACNELGIAFVPFFPLGSGFGDANLVLGSAPLQEVATRLGATPAQVALAWLLDLAPSVLLIPGTSSPAHLRENLQAAEVALDDEARSQLASPGTG